MKICFVRIDIGYKLELLGDNIYCPYDMQTKIYVIGTQHENNFIFNAMI